MATSRTGTAVHKRMRDKVIESAQERGITNCPECRTWLDYQHSGQANSPEADEIVPFKLRGYTSTDLGDWQVLCRRCNQSKGDRQKPRWQSRDASEPVVSQEW